jgi:hypothetical protein
VLNGPGMVAHLRVEKAESTSGDVILWLQPAHGLETLGRLVVTPDLVVQLRDAPEQERIGPLVAGFQQRFSSGFLVSPLQREATSPP